MDKIIRAFTISIVVFAIIFAYFVSTRIDQTTVSVISGAMIGIITAAPLAIIMTLVVARRREDPYTSSYERQTRSSVPLPQNPPQYWMTPQQYGAANNNGYGQSPALVAPSQWQMNSEAAGATRGASPASAQMANSRRRFYVIGEDGQPKMVDQDISEQDDANGMFVMGGADSGAAF